jgi:hypothetical protein
VRDWREVLDGWMETSERARELRKRTAPRLSRFSLFPLSSLKLTSPCHDLVQLGLVEQLRVAGALPFLRSEKRAVREREEL